jgi:hypothetical protein
MTGEPAADPESGPTTEVVAGAASNSHAPSTGAVTAAPPNPLQARVRRTVLAFVAILVLCVPFAVFTLINHEVAASSWAAWAGFTALVTYVLGGRAVAYLTVGLLTALVPIALVVGAVPVAGAGLMAIMCGGVGVSAAWGLHRGMMLIPLFLACVMIAPPVWGSVPVDRNAMDYLLWTMVIWGGGALWAALVFPPLLRKMTPIPREPNTRGDTIIYTTIITVLCTLSTLAVLIWRPGSNGAWLIVTLLVITQVGHVDTLKRTTSRVAGTVIGVAVAAVVASLTTNQTVLIGIGLVLMVIALVIRTGPRYWLYMTFMTPAIVLFSATSGAGVDTSDAQRLLDTLIGAALVLLASAITLWWARHQQTNAVDDPPAEGGHHRGSATA